MKHISDILTELHAVPEFPQGAREAIEEGVRPHRDCPCGPCMRAYLEHDGDPLFRRPPEPVEAK